MLSAGPTEAHHVELAHRQQGPIEVALFWHPASHKVAVVVWNWSSGVCLHLDVEPRRANYAFAHPFAYAAEQGVSEGDIRQAA